MKADMTKRTTLIALSFISLWALFLNVFLLGSQPVSGDDLYVALSGINYMESGQLGPTMWNHPCLRNILVYFALKSCGTGVLGVKGVSLLLGTLCTPLLGLVAMRIFKEPRIALVAAFLWACDPLVIDFSRQGINDIYLAFFPLLGIYLAYRFRESGNPWWLLGSGVGFGLGLASKWSSLFPLVATTVFVLTAVHAENSDNAKERFIRYCHAAVMLLVVPALVYLITFLPWFGRGYALSEWPALQRSMFLETSQHAGYTAKLWDDRDNRAYKWFVVPSVFVDPFLNMDRAGGGTSAPRSFEDSATVVLGVANPLVWLLVIPAVFFVFRKAVRERAEGAFYLTALFLISYLPLVLSPRPIWLNTALSVLPYAVMAVACFVWSMVSGLKRQRLALAAYLTLVLLVALPLYPLAIGKGMRIPVMREYLVKKYLVQFKEGMTTGAAPAAPTNAVPAPAEK